jgi:hypothetical protein
MSNMKKRAQSGDINVLLIPFILVILFFFGAGGFGVWAYMGKQDYKNNVDQKINTAVAASNQVLTSKLNTSFAQQEKNPLQTYMGPQAFGSLKIEYPKTWSAYVAEEDTSNTPINGYFFPGVVPDVTNTDNDYALRVQIIEQSYSSILQGFNGQTGFSSVAYALPNVPNVVGVKLTGAIEPNKQGTMIILPLRSQTLEIWTEASAYQADFNKIIVPNFTFSP